MTSKPALYLKSARTKSLERRHPWIFSGAVARIDGNPMSGETVEILSEKGKFLGRGAYSPTSQILVRVWTFDEGEDIDAAFFRNRLQEAFQLRRDLLRDKDGTTALRLVNAESDGLPGVVIDRYGEIPVCQFTSAGAEKWRGEIVRQLRDLTGAATIFERSDLEVRSKEGLPPRSGLLYGADPPELVEIGEHGCRYLVDIRRGHKTGFYLDQRENRRAAGEFSSGAEVLNCFSYSGGFAVHALQGGAEKVVNIDASADALELARANILLNGLDAGRVTNLCGDVFALLRRFRDEGRRFNLIILDPPKFADSRHQLPGACRGYKDINLLAFKLLKPGGTLFTFSCSGMMEPDLFQKIVADAALDAGRRAAVIKRLFQGEDHPVALNFPEGAYLKGLICRVL
ncbi:MAG: methyltransferase domain-containing protein [Desulfuromonadaceae bacterium]|nr:methyltransferase domain-containing protein [Desulfuromonadaceae bacterium]